MRGSALIEMIVAIGLLGVVLVGLYLGMLFAFKINRQARFVTTAYQVAEQEMEIIRNCSSSLANRTDAAFVGEVEGLEQLPSGQGTLTIADHGGDTNIKEVTVTVTWDNPDASHRTSRNLTTLVTQGGLQGDNTLGICAIAGG